MPSWQIWLFLLFNLIIGLLIFTGRNWIKASIEQSVRSGFEAKLEALRSEFRRSEEYLKSELRSKETEIAALRDGVLSGRAQRQALVDKRRLEAIDGLWAAFTALAPFTMVAKMMGSIKFDVAAREVHRHPNTQQFFRMISGGDQKENLAKIGQQSGRSHQPFVSPLAWAYFSAYQAVVVGAYIRAKVLEIGVEDAHKMINDEPIKDVLKTALPHYTQFIDEQRVDVYHLLLDDLEKHLIAELQKMMRGDEQDQASVEQAARIMEMVGRVDTKQTEQEAEAAVLS
jgi:DNA-binding protein Fis